MSSRMLFDTMDSVRDRLLNTYVFYKGKLCWVYTLGDYVPSLDYSIKMEDKNGNIYEACVNSDPDLQFQRIPLGLVNTIQGPYFCSRTGLRQYRQGLTQDNVVATGLLVDQPHICLGWSIAEPIENTVAGKYPSLDSLIESNKSGAFSRMFARVLRIRTGSDELYYKTKKVGNFKDGVPNLDEQYVYLKESLEESCTNGNVA